jgi:hypothetical protein
LDLKDGTALKAAALVAADTAETAVFVGRGKYWVELVWTALEIATGDEVYFVQFQHDTAAAVGTYLDGMCLAFGNGALMGGAASSAASGRLVVGLWNPYDNNVRVNTWVTGTIATGFNFSVKVYPDVQVPG